MILHLVLFDFKADVTQADIDQFGRELDEMSARLSELRSYAHGRALHLRPDSADYGVLAVVDDEAALRHYLDDPIHVERGTVNRARLFRDRRAIQIELNADSGLWT